LGIIHCPVLQCFCDAAHQYALHYLHSFLYKVEKYDENGLHVISFAVLSIATFFFVMNTNVGFILSVSVLMCNSLRTLSSAVLHGFGAGRVASIVTELQDGHSKIRILAGVRDFALQDAQIAFAAYTVLYTMVWGGMKLQGLQTDCLTTLLHPVVPSSHVQ